MTGSYFLLPMAMGSVLGWASYSVVAHVTSKRQINMLRAISWGVLATLTMMLNDAWRKRFFRYRSGTNGN